MNPQQPPQQKSPQEIAYEQAYAMYTSQTTYAVQMRQAGHVVEAERVEADALKALSDVYNAKLAADAGGQFISPIVQSKHSVSSSVRGNKRPKDMNDIANWLRLNPLIAAAIVALTLILLVFVFTRGPSVEQPPAIPAPNAAPPATPQPAAPAQ